MEDMMGSFERSQFRKEMEKIFDAVHAPDSRPGKIMNAIQPNSSEPWNEDEEARVCDSSIDKSIESFERGVDVLVQPPTKD